MTNHIVCLSDAESRRLATGALLVVRPCKWQQFANAVPLPTEVEQEMGSVMTFPVREPHHWLFHNGIPIRDYEWMADANPLGVPGDVLVCKEAWAVTDMFLLPEYALAEFNSGEPTCAYTGKVPGPYEVDDIKTHTVYRADKDRAFYWRPASTMPVRFARHRPIVVEAGVMRVRDIEWQQAVEAGVVPKEYLPWVYSCLPNCLAHQCDRVPDGRTLCEKYNQGDSDETTVFGMQWDRKYAKKGLGWDANPWVWWARAETAEQAARDEWAQREADKRRAMEQDAWEDEQNG